MTKLNMDVPKYWDYLVDLVGPQHRWPHSINKIMRSPTHPTYHERYSLMMFLMVNGVAPTVINDYIKTAYPTLDIPARKHILGTWKDLYQDGKKLNQTTAMNVSRRRTTNVYGVEKAAPTKSKGLKRKRKMSRKEREHHMRALAPAMQEVAEDFANAPFVIQPAVASISDSSSHMTLYSENDLVSVDSLDLEILDDLKEIDRPMVSPTDINEVAQDYIDNPFIPNLVTPSQINEIAQDFLNNPYVPDYQNLPPVPPWDHLRDGMEEDMNLVVESLNEAKEYEPPSPPRLLSPKRKADADHEDNIISQYGRFDDLQSIQNHRRFAQQNDMEWTPDIEARRRAHEEFLQVMEDL